MTEALSELPTAAGADASSPAARPAPIPLRIVTGWGVCSLATSTMYQVTTVLLLRYLMEYVGLAAVAAGAIISFTKIYDAIVDPFIGTMSDRTRSRWGRRRPYILVGGVVSAASFAFLFALPHASDQGRAWLVALALLANTTGYALVSIPHLAMPAEMTDSFHERTYVMSFRVAALALGQITGTVLGPFLIARYGGGLAGHAVMGFVLGGLILAGTTVSFLMLAGAPATRRVDSPGFTTLEKFKLALGNKPFAVLLGVKLANLVAVSWFFADLPFMFATVTRTGYAQLGFYFLFQGAATFVSQPAWVKLSRAAGKKKTYYLAAVGYGLGVASWVFAGPGEPAAIQIARALFIGVMGGGLLLAASSMLPDAIAHDFERTGLRREGVFAGAYTTIEKASSALAATMIGLALAASGYVQGKAGLDVQPASAVRAIRLFMLAPLGFCVLSALILTLYRLPDNAAPDRARR